MVKKATIIALIQQYDKHTEVEINFKPRNEDVDLHAHDFFATPRLAGTKIFTYDQEPEKKHPGQTVHKIRFKLPHTGDLNAQAVEVMVNGYVSQLTSTISDAMAKSTGVNTYPIAMKSVTQSMGSAAQKKY
ncbi:MAG: hypothetical protein NTU57_02190 [Candidatus Aenigmarchaeota archaeon]|nr:hypothetical protein [Candidatus Aenigmarchaeota archaeon]